MLPIQTQLPLPPATLLSWAWALGSKGDLSGAVHITLPYMMVARSSTKLPRKPSTMQKKAERRGHCTRWPPCNPVKRPALPYTHSRTA